MARDDNTPFRITTWPGNKLPIPWGPDRARYKIEGGTLLATGDFGEPSVDHHEVYLDLLTVALEDEDEILAFVNRHGPLNGFPHAEAFNGFTDHRYFGTAIQPHLEHERSEALQDYIAADEDDAEVVHMAEPLEEFRWEAGCLRDLVTAWRFVHEGKEPEQFWSWVWEGPQDGYSDPNTREGAAHLLARGLGLGLGPFRPHIDVGDDPMPYHESVPFYQICCLELFNHITENARYRTCEKCQRVFVRQTGRAEYGQYRSKGVKYCSRECARAQAQRNYRRRKRAPSTTTN